MEVDNLSRDRGEVCADWRARFQEYLDGDLPKEVSLRVFLHLRGCERCRRELEALKTLFQQLEGLPQAPPPADFDARVLAAVPYDSYRALEPLRRERVPVYLEEDFLPAFVRASAVRAASLGMAGLAAAGVLPGLLPAGWLVVAAVGLLPEALVRLQRAARRAALAARRSESG